mmetsp:Transcript_15237/g.34556  ORF Transcript_15237/g.34556 Transcript_15237/m.34556 type:complete len:99 (+) Transcript_15237:1076-1372(+)
MRYTMLEWSLRSMSEHTRVAEVLAKLALSAQEADLEAPKIVASASAGTRVLSSQLRGLRLLERSGRAPPLLRVDGSRVCVSADDRCGGDLVCRAAACR